MEEQIGLLVQNVIVGQRRYVTYGRNQMSREKADPGEEKKHLPEGPQMGGWPWMAGLRLIRRQQLLSLVSTFRSYPWPSLENTTTIL